MSFLVRSTDSQSTVYRIHAEAINLAFLKANDARLGVVRASEQHLETLGMLCRNRVVRIAMQLLGR